MENTNRKNMATGAALIALGALFLLAQTLENIDFALLIVPAMGVIFLAWGLAVRQVGLLVPGGILSGVGVALVLVENVLTDLRGDAEGGIFVLAVAAGFVLVWLLGTLVLQQKSWWALIPAGLMGLIGAILMIGEDALDSLELLNYVWPAVLIIAGLAILLRNRGQA
ncbi:MAG: hypothetical protein PVG63_01085 [Anaerolineales bacterium]|jgi:hypothetical protein